MQKTSTITKYLDNISATGYSVNVDTSSFDDVYLYFAGTSTPSWNIKVKTGALNVDFTAAASPTNLWTYINLRDTIDDAAIAGGTGVSITTTTPKRIRINDFHSKAICLEATRTGGNLNAWVEGIVRQ